MKAVALPHHIIQWIADLSGWQKFRLTWFTGIFFFFCWMILSYQHRNLPRHVLISNSQVTVLNTGDFISFSPTQMHKHLAYIFYPGALVSPEAYAPYARSIAEHGYKTIIVKMPFRMASFRPNKALELMQQNPEITTWAIGGHSLGGAKAAQFAFEHPERVSGLILVGTSHPRKINMSALPMPATKIYGTNDGLASVEEVEKFKNNLPPHTKFIEIPGGNHAQFGWYGSQLGDSPAAITRKMQQALTIKATLDALQTISKKP